MNLGISDAISSCSSAKILAACTAHDDAICSKNRIIVPYHGDSPNSRISARLRSPSSIMAPTATLILRERNITASKFFSFICLAPTRQQFSVTSITFFAHFLHGLAKSRDSRNFLSFGSFVGGPL